MYIRLLCVCLFCFCFVLFGGGGGFLSALCTILVFMYVYFVCSFDKRLLHPGANTSDIIMHSVHLLSQGLHIQCIHAHTFCGGSEDIFEQKDVPYVLQCMIACKKSLYVAK